MKLTKSNVFRTCLICGSDRSIEMHHIRKIKELRNPKLPCPWPQPRAAGKGAKSDFFTRQMAAINRKQVPLCQDHHTRLHNNTWTNEEKQIFLKMKKSVKHGRKENKLTSNKTPPFFLLPILMYFVQ